MNLGEDGDGAYIVHSSLFWDQIAWEDEFMDEERGPWAVSGRVRAQSVLVVFNWVFKIPHDCQLSTCCA